jgi:hypothetical protein
MKSSGEVGFREMHLTITDLLHVESGREDFVVFVEVILDLLSGQIVLLLIGHIHIFVIG